MMAVLDQDWEERRKAAREIFQRFVRTLRRQNEETRRSREERDILQQEQRPRWRNPNAYPEVRQETAPTGPLTPHRPDLVAEAQERLHHTDSHPLNEG